MKIAENIKGKMNSRCHLNSYKHNKETGSDIYVGYFVDVFRDYIMATPHFFNVQNENIIDTSLGTKKGLYFGKKVNVKYSSADKMFDAELWATLYAEKRIENITDLKEICVKYNLKQLNETK